MHSLTQDQLNEYYFANKAARRFVLLAICLGSMLAPFALASVNLALPVIALDLNANAVIVSWMPTGFLMTSVMSMLPIGKLSDRYGRKRFYFLGVLFTGVFSVLASLGQTMEWLLFCRLLQGISMSMVFASGMAIITSVYPDSERGAAIGLYAASVYLALTLSPVVGGWVTEAFGWRAVFWIQAPPALMVILMLMTIKGEWRDPLIKPFDWTGAVIFAVWIGTLVYGLSGLPKLSSVVTLAISVPYLWLFLYHQKRIKHPLVNLGMFKKNRVFSFSLLASALTYGACYPLSFLLSLFLQLALGYSPLEAGKLLLLQSLVMAIIAPIAGKLSDRFDAGLISTLGCMIMTLGFIGMSFVSEQAESAKVIAAGLIFIGFGFGLFSTPNINATMSAVPKSEVGVASASVNLARVIGNMLGMSFVSLLIYNLIGANEFTYGQTQELTSTVKIWTYLSIIFSLVALTLSYARGKVSRLSRHAKSKQVESSSSCDDLPM